MARTACIVRMTCERSELRRKYSGRSVQWKARSLVSVIGAGDAMRRVTSVRIARGEGDSATLGAVPARRSFAISSAGQRMAMLTPPLR